MSGEQSADITELAALAGEFPLRLLQVGFRLMQAMDEQGHDLFLYIIPPVCEVPAGPFFMGSDTCKDTHAEQNELPQHTVNVGTYQIARYPLTVAEYAYFVCATQRKEPSSSSIPWQVQRAERADHPVVEISWHDALAYAQWLTQLTGQIWRLPAEAEWEKAARGDDGRIYPWGNRWLKARANISVSSSEKSTGTTPVGAFADEKDASPYGVHDMAGNVWEWCSSSYREYPYHATDGRESLVSTDKRILRGGSWLTEPQFVRTTYRFKNLPDYFNYDIGVRLVKSENAVSITDLL